MKRQDKLKQWVLQCFDVLFALEFMWYLSSEYFSMALEWIVVLNIPTLDLLLNAEGVVFFLKVKATILSSFFDFVRVGNCINMHGKPNRLRNVEETGTYQILMRQWFFVAHIGIGEVKLLLPEGFGDARCAFLGH